jgi:hypothetical protein
MAWNRSTTIREVEFELPANHTLSGHVEASDGYYFVNLLLLIDNHLELAWTTGGSASKHLSDAMSALPDSAISPYGHGRRVEFTLAANPSRKRTLSFKAEIIRDTGARYVEHFIDQCTQPIANQDCRFDVFTHQFVDSDVAKPVFHRMRLSFDNTAGTCEPRLMRAKP